MLIRHTGSLVFCTVAGQRSGFMACLNRGSADPSFYRNLSSVGCYPSYSPSSHTSSRHLSRVQPFRNIVADKAVAFSNRFTLACCLDPQQKALNDHWARAIPPHSQLVRNLEYRMEEINGCGSSSNAGLVGVHTVRHGGKSFGFRRKSSTDKVVVAVDVDEVLGNFVSALNKFIADRYSMNHSVSEYHVYEFFKIWNCSRDEASFHNGDFKLASCFISSLLYYTADTRVHEFFKTAYFKNGIYPLPGAQRVLHKLSSHCKLSVVTSRQNIIKDHTVDWLEKHYPGLFHEIHFGNHFALQGESKPKSEICRSLGADILIDDNPRYALECAEVGIMVLLFDYENSYPWSKSDSVEQHPLVTKVYNWQQVEKHIASLITP
ncbi:hypothetical protein LINPERPRIM_LOCUS20926 [Linum perenne]